MKTGETSARGGGPIVLALSMDEAALALGLSRRKVWELTNCGHLPHVRIGRAIRYPVAALSAWVDAQTTGWSE
ncbi:MAG: helix-turn-helix domain-containing protein [Phycisphaerales bacterium]|nr:helix-turn-helix domain-containing protein [Phycisphaerales bacterium]